MKFFCTTLFFLWASISHAKFVSMGPSITESLYAVGLGERVVGVSQYCQYPTEVKGKAIVGTPFSPNLEKLVSLAPEIVFTQGLGDKSFEKKMMSLQLKTISLKYDTYQDIIESLEYLGTLSKKPQLATKIINKIKSEEAGLKSLKLSGKAIIVIEFKTKLGEVTEFMLAGGQTYLGNIIELTGMSVERMRKPYFYYSLEKFLLKPPGVVYLIRIGEKETKQFKKLIKERGLQRIKVVDLNGSYANIPGPRIVNLMGDIRHAH